MDPEIPTERFEIFANGLDHPECLAFDPEGSIWTGGEAGQVYRVSAEGTVATVAELGGFSGGVAWSPYGDLWVCNPKHGIVRVKPSGEWTVFAGDMICPNFGLFDGAGNYYVTDSGNWMKRNGRLLRFAAGGTRQVLLEGYGYTNGLAFDGQTLFMVESDTDRVFAVDPRTGGARVYADQVGRLLDGLALDGSGDLFASCYASDDIHRISTSGNKTLYAYDRWAIKLSRPTNIAVRDGWIYVANLGRTTITRAKVRP
jgi:gluconolactonase